MIAYHECNGVLTLFIGDRVIIQDGKVLSGESINDLPDEVSAAIDWIKQKRRVVTTEDGTIIEEIITELKLVSKDRALDMAMKHEGLYQPGQGEVILKVDESMFRAPSVEDPLGQKILDLKSKRITEE